MDKVVNMGAETQFVNRWLKEKHPNPPLWIRPRLGKAAFPEFARLMEVTLRFPDAIFIEDGVLTIVEAKLAKRPGAIGQLLLYKKLLPETPEFEPFSRLPVQMLLLTDRLDKNVQAVAADHNIIYEVFD